MALHPQAKKKLWLKVRDRKCKLCELHKEAHTVCLMGDGPVPAEIMIVGEAPGLREDDVRKPFAGTSGRLLRSTLASAGIDPSKCFITNVNKCRPPGNRTPKAGEANACRPYLDAELEAVKPKYILAAGNHALRLVKKSGILKHRGIPIDFGDAVVFPTVHPAMVLRNPRYAQVFEADIYAFARLVKGTPTPSKIRIFPIQDKKTLVAACKAILNSEALAYDIETNKLDEREGEIVSVSVSPSLGVAFVLPVHHPESRWKHPETPLSILVKALLFTNAKKIAHNAKFDDKWLIHHTGHPIYADFDTILAAHMLDENRLKSLKPLAQIILGVDAWGIDLTEGKAAQYPFKRLARYNAKDTEYTLQLYYHFREQLKAEPRVIRLFKLLMMPASRVLTDVELAGFYIDKERLAMRMIEIQKKVRKLGRRIEKLAGHPLNVNSPQQLAKVLFDELGLDIIELTEGGSPSTKESVLLRLKDEHKLPKLILEYRQWAKWQGYITSWAEKLDPESRVHANYKLSRAVTGRLSSGKEEGSKKEKGFNIQQVPRNPFMRSIFGAPPGWKLVEADYSQIELRVAAEYSQDPTMLRYFAIGYDIHMATACSTTGLTPDEVDKETRKKAKAINFGFLFGMGWRKFIEYARDNYDAQFTDDEAKAVRSRFFQEYSALPRWHDRQRRLARNYKRVQSLIGRVRHLPDIDSQDKDVRAEAERQAINSPVQSLASDMMLLSMIILHQMFDPEEVKIVATIHDSILFQIRDDVLDKWLPIIRKVMQNLPLKKKFGVTIGVPIKVDIAVGQHWGEGEEIAEDDEQAA